MTDLKNKDKKLVEWDTLTRREMGRGKGKVFVPLFSNAEKTRDNKQPVPPAIKIKMINPPDPSPPPSPPPSSRSDSQPPSSRQNSQPPSSRQNSQPTPPPPPPPPPPSPQQNPQSNNGRTLTKFGPLKRLTQRSVVDVLPNLTLPSKQLNTEQQPQPNNNCYVPKRSVLGVLPALKSGQSGQSGQSL